VTVYVKAYTLTSALGAGVGALRTSLRANRTGLDDREWRGSDVPCFLGRIDLPEWVDVAADRWSRNTRLVEFGLQQDGFVDVVAEVREQVEPDRLGLVLGTSTSAIDRTEEAYRQLQDDNMFPPGYRQPEVHNPHAPTAFAAERLGIVGPRITVSAACASSAKVFATAKRWLEQDLVDAVVVGGADSLCLSVIHGFHSLQLVSPEPCRPFSEDRMGISLGEAAGFVLLSREAAPGDLRLLGAGESCDAYHMSSSHPEGLGARLAMERALADAGISMSEVDYLNLHGTGTEGNDEVEGKVCAEVMEGDVLASATKGWTGHALGASGIVEAVLCLEALATGFVPGTRNTTTPDAPFDLLLESVMRPIDVALTNSFGFGGANCSVAFGR